MRARWFWIVVSLVFGCTTQPIGARCEQDIDCNAPTEVCRSEVSPAAACSGRQCICCPSDPAAAAQVPACVPRTTTRDAGTSD